MREDELDESYFLEEKENQRLGGEAGFQGQPCRMGVHIVKQ